jgi:hypothetical protein
VWDVQITLQVSKSLGSPLLRLSSLFWEQLSRLQESKRQSYCAGRSSETGKARSVFSWQSQVVSNASNKSCSRVKVLSL